MKIGQVTIGSYLILFLLCFSTYSHDSSIASKINQDVDTLKPIILANSEVFEGDIENISGIWLTSNSEPIVEAIISINLFKNQTSNQLLTILQYTTNTDGEFALQFNYTDLLIGNYYWDLTFSKIGYQTQRVILDIEILPHEFDIQLDIQREIVRGEELIIAAIVSYSSENADRFGSPASDIEIKFFITVLLVDESIQVVAKIGITNPQGVAIIRLEPKETESFESIMEVKAEIQSGSQVYEAELVGTNLPVVMSKDESLFDRARQFLENNTVLLTFLTVFFTASTIILLVTRNKVSLKKEMWPEHEK